MHILIGVITAVAGLIWALNALQRSGFNLASLNPFHWFRRRAWQNQAINPLYAIDSPRELAATLAYAVLRVDGEPTSDEKSQVIAHYESVLDYSAEEARQMYGFASHLIGSDPNFDSHLDVIVTPARDAFSVDQVALLDRLMTDIASLDGAPSTRQRALIQRAASELTKAKR